jgi:hypothetical protein
LDLLVLAWAIFVASATACQAVLGEIQPRLR